MLGDPVYGAQRGAGIVDTDRLVYFAGTGELKSNRMRWMRKVVCSGNGGERHQPRKEETTG